MQKHAILKIKKMYNILYQPLISPTTAVHTYPGANLVFILKGGLIFPYTTCPKIVNIKDIAKYCTQKNRSKGGGGRLLSTCLSILPNPTHLQKI